MIQKDHALRVKTDKRDSSCNAFMRLRGTLQEAFKKDIEIHQIYKKVNNCVV